MGGRAPVRCGKRAKRRRRAHTQPPSTRKNGYAYDSTANLCLAQLMQVRVGSGQLRIGAGNEAALPHQGRKRGAPPASGQETRRPSRIRAGNEAPLPHQGRIRVIGAGYGSLGQVNNLPQCGLTCPNGYFPAPMPSAGLGSALPEARCARLHPAHRTETTTAGTRGAHSRTRPTGPRRPPPEPEAPTAAPGPRASEPGRRAP